MEEFKCIVPEGWECEFTNTVSYNVGAGIVIGVILLLVIFIIVAVWKS